MPRDHRERSGVATKVTSDIVRRLYSVKALWFAVNNDPNNSVQDLASDFYFAIGQVLEGVSIEHIVSEGVGKIDGRRVLQHMKEG